MLGCIIGPEGIHANPDKTKAILSMVEPLIKREIQKLIGKIAALNRFISKSAERSLPFFRALKGTDEMEWVEEQLKAFQQFKNYLTSNLTVTVPFLEAPLLLYVAASIAVSAVLVQEKEIDAKVIQQLVYYISDALAGAKLNYSAIEK